MRSFTALILAGIVCAMLIAAGCTGSAPATPATLVATAAATPAAPAAETTAPEATASAAPAAVTAPWTGTWNSTWLERDGNVTVSVLTLTQAGTAVTGTYNFTYPDEPVYTGSINATVTGTTLAGTYTESDEDDGLIIFELSGDNKAFTGKWVHAVAGAESLKNSTLYWNGVRV